MDLIITLLYIVFVLAAIVLIVVILLQEGKGGGFGEALGSGGQETFGVGTKGINSFTASTAGVFLGSALLIHFLNRMQAGGSVLTQIENAPLSAPVDAGAPADPSGGTSPGGTPPAEKKE